MHVTDLARAHVLALRHLLDGGKTLALNLASGKGVSVREVIDTARAITNCKIHVYDMQRRAGDPAILVADATLARELLGWSVERSDLSVIVSDAWHWHKKRFLT